MSGSKAVVLARSCLLLGAAGQRREREESSLLGPVAVRTGVGSAQEVLGPGGELDGIDFESWGMRGALRLGPRASRLLEAAGAIPEDHGWQLGTLPDRRWAAAAWVSRGLAYAVEERGGNPRVLVSVATGWMEYGAALALMEEPVRGRVLAALGKAADPQRVLDAYKAAHLKEFGEPFLLF